MPTTSVEDARQWRRARWLECEKNGPLPHFLNYEERVSLAQDIFDYAVYELGVSPQAACQIAFRIDCRKARPWRDCRIYTGESRKIPCRGQQPIDPWFLPLMGTELHESELTPKQFAALDKRREEMDREAVEMERLRK